MRKMRIIIASLTIIITLIMALTCKSQYYNDASLCGKYGGVEGGKHRNNQIAYYVSLELNMDHTCSLKKTFDLSGYIGQGEWAMRNDGVIEISLNSVVDDFEKLLMGGGIIEGTFEIQVLSENRLRLGDTVLKRIK